MRDDVTANDGLVFILCVLIFCLGSTLSYVTTYKVCKNQAYEAGVGHYVTNEESGKTDYVFECQVCASNKLAAALAKEEQAD